MGETHQNYATAIYEEIEFRGLWLQMRKVLMHTCMQAICMDIEVSTL